MWLWKLLSGVAESGVTGSLDDSSSGSPVALTFWQKYGPMFIWGVIIVAAIAFFIYRSRKSKKLREERMEELRSLGVGTKIETIGGVFGTIVEMDKESGTFVLETGSDVYGKTYIRFDLNAIGRIEPTAKPVAEAPVEVNPDFAPAEENAEENSDDKTEE